MDKINKQSVGRQTMLQMKSLSLIYLLLYTT